MERIPACWFTSVSLFLLSSPKVQLEGMTEKFILQTSFKYLLKVFSFYLDTFTYCSMTAILAIFIILHPYGTILSILILLCIKSLWLVHHLLQVCTLNMYFITPPSPPDNNCLHPPKCVFQSCSLRNFPFTSWKTLATPATRGPAILQPCVVFSAHLWSIALVKKPKPIAGYSVFSPTRSGPQALCGFSTWVLLKKWRGQERKCLPAPLPTGPFLPRPHGSRFFVSSYV